MNSFFKIVVFVLLAGIAIFISCKKEYSCENCIGKNQPPIANAGRDTTIVLPTASIKLDGSASIDPDGSISSYKWTKISGPDTLTVVFPDSAITKVNNLVKGVYSFELSVTDNEGLSVKDTIQVKIDSAAITNHPPIAKAGADTIIVLPAHKIELDGGKSSDLDNNITSYNWIKISGPSSFNITNGNAAQTQVTDLAEGIYYFELQVTDAGGLFSKDTIQISVIAGAVISSCDNRPIINATLVQIGTLTEPRFGLVSAAVNNKILFAGGQSETGYSSRVDIYDIATNTWSTAELSTGDRMGMSAATVGNKVLFAGGMENDVGITTSRVDIYDASTNSWSQAELSKARAYLAAATIDNKVFFAGGGSYESSFMGSTAVDIYDNSTSTWTTATLSQRRSFLTATIAGNKIFFAGGAQGPGETGNISTRVDIYDGTNNSWSTTEMQEGKSNMASAVFNNKIFWASGSKQGGALSDRVEIKDLNTGASSFACVIPRTDFSAVIKGDNIVFFTGNTSNFSSFGNKFEIYNTTTDTWSTGVLNQRISYSTIISVNNTIYVAGGTADGGPLFNKVWKLEF